MKFLENLLNSNALRDTLCLESYKGGGLNASILHEMSNQERNEGCQGDNHEEWEASDSRRLPGMWD
jgi:hypothetical protein